MSLWSRLERRLGDLAGELVLDDYRDQLNQARSLLAGGDVQAAIDVLEALLAVKPDHGQALIVLGDARLATRDPQRAQEAYDRALKIRSGDPAALVGLGLALVALGKYEVAVSSLSRAVADAGGDRGILADAYRGLGVAWRRRGDLDKAIRELRKAVVEDGEDGDARAALGEALVADGGPYDEAQRHLERAAAAPQPPALALYGLARIALLVEDAPAIAGAQLARARQLADADQTPLGAHIRCEIFIAQGDAALAERDAMRAHGFYLEALQLEPKRSELHARIAATHRAIGNLDAALASYDRVLALDPSIDALRAAVDTAIAAGDTTRGQPWSNDLLAKDPNDVRALVARGMAYASAQPQAAKALLELAAARDDVDAHVELAKLALASHEPSRAAASALAALRVVPTHARARAILADARGAELGLERLGREDIAELAAFVERAVASRRELGHHVGEIARAAAGLDQPLLVTVMGEFSSGKSSFVNAFIGADVAPTGITPTTATINVVRYGRERGGRILAADGTTLELGWDDLMTHLRALTPDAARAIDRVEILVPLPQLERVNIVDTPGLNSIQPEHEATARAFIAKADAVVWVFTAGQGGKASEKKALQSIRDEGKRVLGVLNKADQLSSDEVSEVTGFISGTLGELVETVVPVSARDALAWKRDKAAATGNWPALATALEERFFQQARALKRDACARALRGVIAEAEGVLASARVRASEAAAAAHGGRDELLASARQFVAEAVTVERKQLSEQLALLYRRAAREVLDLVRPRRLPFSSHSATIADRDYLIALLSSGFESAIEGGRKRVAGELATRGRMADAAARALGAALATDVTSDLERVAADRIGLALSRVFDRAHAYLRGYLEGGYVEAFFKNDVPRLELAEDAIYHALYRSAPNVDREINEPLARAAHDALAAIAQRLEHWSAVVDVQALDLEVGVGRALELAAERLRG
jgi:tetratricopeptide (TPR) repeat protein/GTP-binding protein EngB required for normal cell division